MTKPMPTSYIKENKPPSWLKFKTFSRNSWFGQSNWISFSCIYFFYEKNATEKEYLYNEIFPPIIQKQKTFDANERSAYQLLELFHKTNDKPQSYRCTAKSHATMFPKQFIPFIWKTWDFLLKDVVRKWQKYSEESVLTLFWIINVKDKMQRQPSKKTSISLWIMQI